MTGNIEYRAQLVGEFFKRYHEERPEHLCFDHDGFEGALFYAARSYGTDAVFRYFDKVLDFGIEIDDDPVSYHLGEDD